MPKKVSPATKADVQEAIQASDKRTKKYTDDRMEGMKKYIDGKIDEVKYHFDAAVEIIREDLIGANQDEMSAMKDKVKQHDQRLTALEQR